MAKLIDKSLNTVKSSFKGGMLSGIKAGVIEGSLGVFIHPFFARSIGSIIAGAMIKDPVEKKVVLVEGIKEGIFTLFAGN